MQGVPRLKIAQKIVSIAALALMLMAMVALCSIQQTTGISADLRSIADRHMPT